MVMRSSPSNSFTAAVIRCRFTAALQKTVPVHLSFKIALLLLVCSFHNAAIVVLLLKFRANLRKYHNLDFKN